MVNKSGEAEAIFPILPGMNLIEEAFLAFFFATLIIHLLALLKETALFAYRLTRALINRSMCSRVLHSLIAVQ
jgi:hypothetical protein